MIMVCVAYNHCFLLRNQNWNVVQISFLWVDWLFARVFFVLFHNRICLDITEGCGRERWLRGVPGEKLRAAPMLPSWACIRAWLSYRAELVTEPHRDFSLPFSQQINNLSKAACCYLHRFPCIKPSTLLIPGLGLEESPPAPLHAPPHLPPPPGNPSKTTCLLFVGHPPAS